MPPEELTYRNFLDKRLDKQDATLSEILLQTRTTNGRVNKLENWQSYIIGFCACLALLVTIATAIIAALISR